MTIAMTSMVLISFYLVSRNAFNRNTHCTNDDVNVFLEFPFPVSKSTQKKIVKLYFILKIFMILESNFLRLFLYRMFQHLKCRKRLMNKLCFDFWILSFLKYSKILLYTSVTIATFSRFKFLFLTYI